MPLCNKFPRDTVEVNSEQIRRITETSSTNQFIIYPTTNSGYGIGQKIDGKSIECTEETPLNPISLYGKTKTEAEKYVLDKGNGVSFRLATVFGLSARMRLDLLVNDFTVRALRDKYIVLFEAHFKRNFIHIKDVCKAFEWSMTFPSMFRSKTFNVGLSSSNLSKLELCEKIKLQIPDFYITTSEFNKDPDQRDYIVSNKKLEDTGWYPNYKLEDGIAEIIAAYPLLTNNNGMYNFV
jgi:nucleoside-diphosphate-sugar epimerase